MILALQIILSVCLVVILAVIGWKIGKRLFSLNGKIAARKRALLKVSISLREFGLKLLPQVIEDYVVSDAADMIDRLQDMARMVDAGSDLIEKDLNATFENCLSKKLATLSGIAYVKAMVAKAEAA